MAEPLDVSREMTHLRETPRGRSIYWDASVWARSSKRYTVVDYTARHESVIQLVNNRK